jgi:hypothetical protein
VNRIVAAALVSFCLPMTALAAEPPDAAKPHWSLQKRSRPAAPRFADAADRAWVRTPIDAFILARLKQTALRPAPAADRATLIRRATFDLTGLPPTPAEVDAFVTDPAADAYERLVDRLLASPHYGEKWGRHWLDVVRFAETEGFEYDRYRPGAWRYRDYVIRAFNDDKPYDRFVQEQLAGDEVDGANEETRTAVGFHRLGPVRRNAGNGEVAFSRNEVLTERADVIGAAFLGLTVGCARCHDHKFDDISQADYYGFQAFLATSQDYDIWLAPPEVQANWKARTDQVQAEIKKMQKALAKAGGAARTRLQARLKEAERRLPPPLPTISSVHDVAAERTPVHVLKRGETRYKGKQVGPRFLTALPARERELPPDANNPRLALARWLTNPEHPLTARVLVNRVWQYHFGTGLVATPNDFGVNGAPPSHPDLLDYLANEFVAHGWRLKPLHRLILLSSTYLQSSYSAASRLGTRTDPDDRLLRRFSRRRLTAEEVRDAMLRIAGKLNAKAGGPSVVPPVDADLVRLLYNPAQWTVTPDPAEHDRRSVYLIAKRNLRLPFTEVFDQPDAQTSCARRESSTHAPQALELLNGRTSNRLAEAFAERLRREAGPDHARQVELAYRLAAGRGPTETERARALKFLEGQPLREFALAVLNLNAFLYVN